MATFRNRTGQPLLLVTWSSEPDGAPPQLRTGRVAASATVALLGSASGEWAVYLEDPYIRIGTVWAEGARSSRADTFGVERFAPPGGAAYYVAWARPAVVRA